MSAAARTLVLALAVAVTACGKPEPPPSPDLPQPAVPNLAGLDVMVLPAQPGPGGVPTGFDEALGEALLAGAPTVAWILPPELDRALSRAPWLNIRPRALSVSILRNPETERIGDPLYGDLRRLGSVVDARYAVVIYQAAHVAPADSVGGYGRIEVAASIIDTVGGRILWRGLLAGERGPRNDEVVLATVVQEIVRMIGPVN